MWGKILWLTNFTSEFLTSCVALMSRCGGDCKFGCCWLALSGISLKILLVAASSFRNWESFCKIWGLLNVVIKIKQNMEILEFVLFVLSTRSASLMCLEVWLFDFIICFKKIISLEKVSDQITYVCLLWSPMSDQIHLMCKR